MNIISEKKSQKNKCDKNTQKALTVNLMHNIICVETSQEGVEQ
jgi:hypothetical protein